ncbi:hypothetical protein EZS27_027941 [termite gut metagenome]|uniref:Uncharacterized protein n=1 Tax=termite gut metagenome TaxID=433724 RepID=A0A5J4QKX6_9ZZZZ
MQSYQLKYRTNIMKNTRSAFVKKEEDSLERSE